MKTIGEIIASGEASKAPWVVSQRMGHDVFILGPASPEHPNGEVIARMSAGRPRLQANAKVLAASRETLAALETVMGWFDTGDIRHAMAEMGETSACNKAIRQARAAIAKARP